jgi:hypothetical protein
MQGDADNGGVKFLVEGQARRVHQLEISSNTLAPGVRQHGWRTIHAYCLASGCREHCGQVPRAAADVEDALTLQELDDFSTRAQKY